MRKLYHFRFRLSTIKALDDLIKKFNSMMRVKMNRTSMLELLIRYSLNDIKSQPDLLIASTRENDNDEKCKV